MTPKKDKIKGNDNIQKLLDKLKQTEPEMCSELTDYIDTITTGQNNAESKLAAAEAELAQMQNFYDNSSQGAVVLEKPTDSGKSLLSWIIAKANHTTAAILEAKEEPCIGRKLSDFLNVTHDIEIPDIIDSNFNEKAEFDIHNLNKHLIFKMQGQNDGTIACIITDETEMFMLRNQLDSHLHRFELISETVTIANTEKSYPQAFNRILERIGFHLSPKRVMILIDNPGSTMCQIEYQWVAKDIQPLSHDIVIAYNDCPSWQTMLNEHKLIPGTQISDLPDDIEKTLEKLGIKNAYIFPMTNINGTSYGSILFEAYENRQPNKLEISYIRIISIVISGIIHINRILNDLIHEKERAEESDMLKSSFLVNMSHDIRIPMNSIIGFSDLLADEDLTQTEREEFIEMINKSGQDLVTLIDNIIDISRIETGQLTVKREACPLAALLNDIMATYKHDRRLDESDELSLQLDFAPKYADLKFSTDIFRFRQICTNLIDNSLKFTEKGYVRFGVSKAWGNTIEFYVQDTGIGIPEDHLPIIFNRFIKVDRSFANEYNGTGLGLAICKSLVEMLGGEIHVVSVLGKGSTFYFTHPLDCEVPEQIDNQREVKSLYDWKSRKMVIVDNIEQDCKYLTYVLSNTGIEIVWFKTGNEALNYFESGNMADIILIEMNESNLEAARKIHRSSPAPIIAQSTDNKSDEDRALARKSGCIELINKPLSPSTFLMTIDRLFKL